jgi:hypothetical protein
MFTFEQQRDGTHNFEGLPSDNGLQPPRYSISEEKKKPLEPVTSVFETGSRSPSSDFHVNWVSGLLDKFLIITSMIIPLMISSILLGATVLSLHSTGMILNFIISSRATTQILVSIFSATLATLNIYTITKLVNIATRIHLLEPPSRTLRNFGAASLPLRLPKHTLDRCPNTNRNNHHHALPIRPKNPTIHRNQR